MQKITELQKMVYDRELCERLKEISKKFALSSGKDECVSAIRYALNVCNLHGRSAELLIDSMLNDCD